MKSAVIGSGSLGSQNSVSQPLSTSAGTAAQKEGQRAGHTPR
jgi:hypothetical protein